MGGRNVRYGAIAFFAIILTTACAFAQQSDPPSDADKIIAFFYKDPKPEKLLSVIEQLEKRPSGGNWEVYPPIAGMLAVIFRKHPDQIEKLIPSTPNARTAETTVAALQLSSNAARLEQLLPRLQSAGRDNQLAAEFSGLPARLEDLQIRSPTHLDILWGASFANGDPTFVLMIIEFFARTANRSEEIAMDVTRTAIAIAGGPKGPLLGPKYGEGLGREIVFAAIALWAIRSNSQQHEFVDTTVNKYIQDHPARPAAHALAAATGRKR